MKKILLAVDGSESSGRAVEHVIALAQQMPALEIHALSVQAPIVSGHAKMFLSSEQINEFYRGEAAAALAPARVKLDAAGAKYQHHAAVGHIAETITNYAHQQGCDQIVIGTRGMSAISNLVLGSVATKVIHLAHVPVTLVK